MTQTDSLPAAHSAQLDAICRPAGVIPVLAIQRLEDAVPLGRALVEGGLPYWRSPCVPLVRLRRCGA